MTVIIQGPLLNQSEYCAPILRALPQWFGIEEATQHYIDSISELPTFLAFFQQDCVGFLSIKPFLEYAADIYVMGIHPDYHHQGIGKTLLRAAEDYLRSQGVLFLQVKTLSERHPDPFYAKTRAFYQAVGFVPLEEFPELWGPQNPCLQMIKALTPQTSRVKEDELLMISGNP